MKAIDKRLRRLEESLTPQENEEVQSLVTLLRERRRRAEAYGEPFEVRQCERLTDDHDRLLTSCGVGVSALRRTTNARQGSYRYHFITLWADSRPESPSSQTFNEIYVLFCAQKLIKFGARNPMNSSQNYCEANLSKALTLLLDRLGERPCYMDKVVNDDLTGRTHLPEHHSACCLERMPRIRPTVDGTLMSRLRSARFGWLKRLVARTNRRRCTFSRIAVFLISPKSNCQSPGPG